MVVGGRGYFLNFLKFKSLTWTYWTVRTCLTRPLHLTGSAIRPEYSGSLGMSPSIVILILMSSGSHGCKALELSSRAEMTMLRMSSESLTRDSRDIASETSRTMWGPPKRKRVASDIYTCTAGIPRAGGVVQAAARVTEWYHRTNRRSDKEI